MQKALIFFCQMGALLLWSDAYDIATQMIPQGARVKIELCWKQDDRLLLIERTVEILKTRQDSSSLYVRFDKDGNVISQTTQIGEGVFP